MKKLSLVVGMVVAGAMSFSFVLAQQAPFSFQLIGGSPKPTPTNTAVGPLDASCYQYISISPTMNIGDSFTAIIPMKNTGTTTWTKSAGFFLGTQNPQDNTTWKLGRVELPVASVPKNGIANFKATFQAPLTPGDYTFDWKMVQEGNTWFGATCTPTTTPTGKIKVVNPPNAALSSTTNIPASVVAGQPFDATISIQNTSRRVWSKARDTVLSRGPYSLGSQTPQDNVIWGTARADFPLAGDVRPNTTGIFHISATAPTQPGTYAFRWQMVEEGAGWFGPTVGKNIKVVPADFACTQNLRTIAAGQSVAFQCNGIPSGISSVKWTAIGGSPANGSGNSFTTSYAAAGSKTVVLTYSKGRGESKKVSYTVTVTGTPVVTPVSTPTVTPTPTTVVNPYDPYATPTVPVNAYNPASASPVVTIPLTANITSPAANATFALGQNIPVAVSGNGNPYCGYWTLKSPSGQTLPVNSWDFVAGAQPGNIPSCREPQHDPY